MIPVRANHWPRDPRAQLCACVRPRARGGRGSRGARKNRCGREAGPDSDGPGRGCAGARLRDQRYSSMCACVLPNPYALLPLRLARDTVAPPPPAISAGTYVQRERERERVRDPPARTPRTGHFAACQTAVAFLPGTDDRAKLVF
jgi:hypothetical protein